jgi:glucosylglycerate phosphorylase
MELSEFQSRAITLLSILYPDRAGDIFPALMVKMEKAGSLLPDPTDSRKTQPDLTHEAILITYGNSLSQAGEHGLVTLANFLKSHVGDLISTVHVLPFFPFTSDDGFSVVNYLKIDPNLGTWANVADLSTSYNLMFDAVINHVSQESEWFQRFLRDQAPERDYFITADPDQDYSLVVRPRTLPLLTRVETACGWKYVWTTFSADQIDLNFANPDLLGEILSILVSYAKSGASLIRLDAIAYAWKKAGTRCLSLPETHTLVKLIRLCLDYYAPGTRVITETNVPHLENISYFGNGDEAKLVYQFALPPLTLFSFRSGNACKLMKWLQKLEQPPTGCHYFNFLSSHDGIGLMPVENILDATEREFLEKSTLMSGGKISYKDLGDGTQAAYELNINYQDALAAADEPDGIRVERFLSAMTFLISLKGVPGIYIHSLLGSRNNYEELISTGMPRRINRGSIDYKSLEQELNTGGPRQVILNELMHRLQVRAEHPALSVEAAQQVIDLDHRLISFTRTARTGEQILVLINVSDDTVQVDLPSSGLELISNRLLNNSFEVKARRSMWIQLSPSDRSPEGGAKYQS